MTLEVLVKYFPKQPNKTLQDTSCCLLFENDAKSDNSLATLFGEFFQGTCSSLDLDTQEAGEGEGEG
jgi:hypothetical protein